MSTTSTAASSKMPRLFRGRRTLVFAMPVLLLGVLGLYLIFTHGQVSTDDAQVDGRLVPVSPKISGYISELLVDDNQIVHKGAVIARIDPRDAQVRVDQALAALKVAQAQAASSLSDVPLTAGVTGSAVAGAEANLADARAEYARARATSEKAHHADTSLISANVADRQANYERTRADLARMKDLADKHEISHLQYDRFVADELMAKSQLEAAQQSLASQGGTAQISDAIVQAAAARVQQAQAQLSAAHTNRGQVGMRSQDADAMQAAVLAAHANLDAAKLQVSYTEIIAPQEGKVTRRTVEAGAYVAPGQTLLTLVPTRDVWVTANFKETQLRNVHGGERVEVKVDQLGRTFSGHVASVSNATGSRLSLLPPENATGNFVKIVQRIPVKIALDPEAVSSNALSVGANVDVTIHTR